MTPAQAARAYYGDLSMVSQRAVRLLLRSWRQIGRADITASWARALPDMVALMVAAQTVAAEFADPYFADVLANPGVPAHPVDPGGFGGTTPIGEPVSTLLFRPVTHVLHDIGQGFAPAVALRSGASDLAMYARTLVADTGRLAVSAGMGARPHVTGYYRMLSPPSCARCAILAGKHYRYNDGFQRHPRCDCVHIPVREADDSLAFDARKAIEAGKVTGLSHADTYAILNGADPAQVVNARRGMYTAGGASFTRTGTTRLGIAGARLLAKDVARALGGFEAVAGKTFRNLTFDRLTLLKYQELLSRGTTYSRLTRTGRVQSYAYRFTRTRRLTPEQILRDATSRDEMIRLLINNGYII